MFPLRPQFIAATQQAKRNQRDDGKAYADNYHAHSGRNIRNAKEAIAKAVNHIEERIKA